MSEVIWDQDGLLITVKPTPTGGLEFYSQRLSPDGDYEAWIGVPPRGIAPLRETLGEPGPDDLVELLREHAQTLAEAGVLDWLKQAGAGPRVLDNHLS